MIRSAILRGLRAIPIEIEVALTRDSFRFIIVGLGRAAVKESHVRLRHAITSSGFQWPKMGVTINLAPAGVPKESSILALALALSILEKSGQVVPQRQPVYAIGELGLEGNLRICTGALVVARIIPEKAMLVAPYDNKYELALLRQISEANKQYFPPGTVEQEIEDDTMPGGPVRRTIVYEAPFDKCDREEDYEIAWREFERRGLECKL